MFDAGSRSNLQRARGRAHVGWKAKGGKTALAHLHQSGCAKILLPQTYGAPPEAVIINTSGGITGGDRLEYSAEVASDTEATLTTQAAERIYRASTDEARITTQITIGAGATLHWLPQETILFEGSALSRHLHVKMDEAATALIAETIILGREAMGETLSEISLSDQWRIHKGGTLIHAEALRLKPPLGTFQSKATLGGHRALSTLAYIGADAEDRLTQARDLLRKGHASAWNGKLICRWLGRPEEVKADLMNFLTHFRAAPLPRVWHL